VSTTDTAGSVTPDPATPGSGVDLAIRTTGLAKVFRKQRAVDGIDLVVPRGAVL